MKARWKVKNSSPEPGEPIRKARPPSSGWPGCMCQFECSSRSELEKLFMVGIWNSREFVQNKIHSGHGHGVSISRSGCPSFGHEVRPNDMSMIGGPLMCKIVREM